MIEAPVALTETDIDHVEQHLTGKLRNGEPMLEWITQFRRTLNRRRASAGLPVLDRVAFWNLYVGRTGPLAYAESRNHPDAEIWVAIKHILTERAVQSVDADIAAEREALARRRDDPSKASEAQAAAVAAVEPTEAVSGTLLPDAWVSDRTGAPGRPTSMHLIRRELERRAASTNPADALGSSIDGDAPSLLTWLAKTYPQMRPPQPTTIGRNFRALHRNLRGAKQAK